MPENFTDKQEDPSEQLIGEEGIADFETVKQAFERTITDCGEEVDRARKNYDARFSIWAGQTDDGKKHAREGVNIEPTPWDGASDLKTYEVDEIINLKVALYCTAFRRANMIAVPVEGSDLPRARTVTTFMKWLVQTQIPDMEREVELTSQYVAEKGKAIVGIFWESCQDKVLTVMRLSDAEAQMPGITEAIQDPALTETFLELIQQRYDITPKRAKRILKELRETGESSIPTNGRKYSRPSVRALCCDEDIWIHPSVTDIEHAPGIYRTQYFTPAQLRSFINTDRWSEAWVEEAIETCKGKSLSSLPDSQNSATRRVLDGTGLETEGGLVGVVFAYERKTDEEGIPGIYLSVFNPQLPANDKHDGFAKTGLLGFSHGRYPFVLFRREYLSRRALDSRGVPEVGKPFQDVLKATSDGRIDAMSISIIPPLMYPAGRPPGKWGPGARVPYRRDAGEYRFADRPAYDNNTTAVEDLIEKKSARYFGRSHPANDPAEAQLKQQHEVGRWMACWNKVMAQIWDLYKQFGENEVYYRVIGVKSENAMKFDKGQPGESFDFFLSYDVLQTDREATSEKLELIAKVAQTADKFGMVDWAEYLQVALESIDPALAERIITPKESATEKAVSEEREALTQISAGFDLDIDERAPAEVGLGVMQQFVQSPDVQKKLMSDEAFRARMEKRQKQYSFQLQQRENAKVGRLGA